MNFQLLKKIIYLKKLIIKKNELINCKNEIIDLTKRLEKYKFNFLLKNIIT